MKIYKFTGYVRLSGKADLEKLKEYLNCNSTIDVDIESSGTEVEEGVDFEGIELDWDSLELCHRKGNK